MRASASPPPLPSPALRALASGSWVLSTLAVLALGGFWLRDRVRGWETPRWDEARFVRVASGASSPLARPERWVVVVNPECPHCGESLARAAAARARLAPPPWLGALLVDTRVRPDSGVAGMRSLDGVWWDADGVWRGRWGHRVYGEVLRFAPEGGYLGSFFPPQGSSPRGRPSTRLRARQDS